MTKIAEASVACTDKLATIYTPLNIAEQTRASGFAFSRRLARQTGINQNELSPAFFEGSQVFKHADLAQKLASDSAGGATVGENSITLWVASGNATAASEADYIWMYFGLDKRVKLLGRSGQFPEGAVLTWDLNNLSDWLEDNVTADLWVAAQRRLLECASLLAPCVAAACCRAHEIANLTTFPSWPRSGTAVLRGSGLLRQARFWTFPGEASFAETRR